MTSRFDEIIAVVDANDEIVGSTTRREAHSSPCLHREVYVYLVNSKKQVLLQKRADNGKWSDSCAGHMPLEEGYLEGAVREFEEELGIKIPKEEFHLLTKEKITVTSHSNSNERFAALYIISKDIALNEFHIDPAEVAEVQYFSLEQAKTLLAEPDTMTGAGRYFLEKYILPCLEGKEL